MFQIYGIPPTPSIFEMGSQPRPVHISNNAYAKDEKARSIHSHAEITEILLNYRGLGLHQVGDRMYHSRPGDLVIINVDMLHNDFAQTEEGIAFYCLGVTNLCIKGLPTGCLAANEQQIELSSGDKFGALLSMFQLMECALRDREACGGELARSLAACIVVTVHAIAANVSAEPDGSEDSKSLLVRSMLSYINSHYTEDFSLDDLAAAVGVSRYYASHLFREQTGYTPTGYRLQRRIGEAQSLLIGTDYSITYIAGAVGYDNPNHFTQSFTKLAGVSPKEFRSLSVRLKVPAGRR